MKYGVSWAMMQKIHSLPFTVDSKFRVKHFGKLERCKADIILQFIERDISNFNISNIEQDDIHFIVNPAKDASSVYDEKCHHIGSTSYTFEKWSSDSEPEQFDVDLNSDFKISLHQEIQGQETRVLGLYEWLQTQAESEVIVWDDAREQAAIVRRHKLTKMQWSDWLWLAKTENKKFRLLDLPAELRLEIYDLALGGRQGPDHSSNSTSRYARLGKHERWFGSRVVYEQPNVRCLLRLNRQIHNEASDFLYDTTTFRASHKSGLLQLLRDKILAKNIRRLELSLTHEEYLKIFQPEACREPLCNCSLRSHYRFREISPAMAKVIHSMNLDHLTIEIDEPQEDYSFMHNPAAPMIPCQKLTVDLILKSILPWIAGNAVTIQGSVKTKQKIDFEATCAEFRKPFLKWREATSLLFKDAATVSNYVEDNVEEDGGVRLDATGEETVRQREEAEKGEETEKGEKDDAVFPQQCECRVNCSPAMWSADN